MHLHDADRRNRPVKIRRKQNPTLLAITDTVYSSIGYAISNVLYVITNASLVVIDTTESIACGRASLADFRERNSCQLPISHIIYTHYHNDHVGGARAFYIPGTQVLAHNRLETEREKNSMLAGYRLRADILQFGLMLPVDQRGVTHKAAWTLDSSPRLCPRPRTEDPDHIPPTITFEDEYCFSQGGTRFELYHTEGETYDHLMVWLPGEQVLFPGDLFYGNFPMLSNPLKPARPILQWAESLDRMRALRPKFLVPSHGKPVLGFDAVESALANYSEAIRFIHDETVNRMNRGELLEQICSELRLPERLASQPYLQERYGTVRWTVKGIFLEYAGWYTWRTKDLNPSPERHLANALVEACGTAQPLLERARRARKEGNDQLALELAELILAARPHNAPARALKIRCLRTLAVNTINRVERNLYLAAAADALAGDE